MTSQWVVSALQWAGPLLFVGMQGSSCFTAVQIIQQQSCGLLSPIPFGTLFINCFIWSLYGRIEQNSSVLYPNMSGLFVATFCLVVYHQYCGLIKPWRMYGVILASSALCLFLSRIGDSHSIGLLGCLLSIAVSGSPLAVIQTVIKEKSTAAMPFITSCATWLNTLSWTLFGYIVANDPFIYWPNILGFVLASLQMALFAVYGCTTKVDKREKSERDDEEFLKMVLRGV